MERLYVEVVANFTLNGNITPSEIVWEDGKHYKIDKVLDMRQAASLKVGGQGDRYLVRIGRHKRYLFFERSADLTGRNVGRWFIEPEN